MAEGSSERSARAESGEIATSTLAEIYAQQGLLGRALSIYRRMLARTPEDAEITGRIQSLERRIAETGPEPEIAGPPEPSAERERLPWDPPEDDEADGPIQPRGEAAVDAPPRVGPIDSRAFEAWLEGR
ncbi:MAG: hypothetical protein ACREK2_09220 [Gemmatimonadota bacterium]